MRFADSPHYAKYQEVLARLIAAKRKQYAGNSGMDLPLSHVVRAECQHFSQKIHRAIPELKVQKGFINNHMNEHWWLDYNGEIVDPTVEQFGNRELKYIVFDPKKHEVYLGKCMDCGDPIYGIINTGVSKNFCDAKCEARFEIYMRTGT